MWLSLAAVILISAGSLGADDWEEKEKVRQHEHFEHLKTFVVTKKVPKPVKVEVEKHVPYEVKVPVDKPYPVYVPKPYNVYVEKKVPYEVKVPVPMPYIVEKKVPYEVKVPVDKPYPVEVPKPYNVYVEKKIPFVVEKKIPYKVQIPVEKEYPVPYQVEKEIPYPVIKEVPYEVRVPVEKPVPYPVEKPVPYEVEEQVLYPVIKEVPYPVRVDGKSFHHAEPSADEEIGKSEDSAAPTVQHSFSTSHKGGGRSSQFVQFGHLPVEKVDGTDEITANGVYGGESSPSPGYAEDVKNENHRSYQDLGSLGSGEGWPSGSGYAGVSSPGGGNH